MTLNGQFTRLEPDRIDVVELYLPDWSQGETHVRTDLRAEEEATILTMTIDYVDGPTRDIVLNSGYAPALQTALDRLAAPLAAE